MGRLIGKIKELDLEFGAILAGFVYEYGVHVLSLIELESCNKRGECLS